MSATMDSIKRIISQQLGIRKIGDHDHFIENLGAESVDVMNIVVAVEEKYGITIKESEIPHIQTPATLYNFVISRL